MSFSRQSKQEILSQELEDTDSCLAFLSGLFHGCGQITKNSDGLRADLVTEIQEMFTPINKMVQQLYGDQLKLEISDDYIINKTTYYRMMFPLHISKQVLQDCGILSREGDCLEILYAIDANIIPDENCKRAFIKGAYVGCSTSSIKFSELGSQKTTTGYHLEFTSHNQEFLLGLKELLTEFGIVSKLFERKNNFVLYLKDSEAIKDILALVGAGESAMALANEMATRGLRNTVNRQVNCINANINKTVDASLKQIHAIQTIDEKLGLDNLPEDLQEVAVLRLANQQESMEELLKLSTIELTKSGLNHRFRRLIRIADCLMQQNKK